MGLDFSRPASDAPQMQGQVVSAPPAEQEDFQQYDIVADRQQMNEAMTNSPEVDRIASQIEVYNLESIVSFGAGAAAHDARFDAEAVCLCAQAAAARGDLRDLFH